MGLVRRAGSWKTLIPHDQLCYKERSPVTQAQNHPQEHLQIPDPPYLTGSNTHIHRIEPTVLAMSTMVRILLAPLGWPISLIPLLLAFVFLINRAVSHILTRGPLPSGALAAKGWPLLGSIDFFRCRGDFLKDGREQSPNGHFSFYYGPHPIVALSGEAARQAYLNVRGLNLFAG